MKVILSIKPEFAFKIFNGTKRFEFRKAIFKNPDVKQVIVYASSPVQRVIGEFEIDSILKCNKQQLWELTKKEAGITEDFFFQYFKEKEEGYAIRIKNTKMYQRSKCLKTEFNLLPPQSFAYFLPATDAA